MKIENSQKKFIYFDLNLLRVYFAIGLLIVGVLFPEEKTMIGGLNWPPFIALVGVVIILISKRRLNDGVLLCGSMIVLILLIPISSLIFFLIGLQILPESDYILKHYSTLVFTTSVSFLLVSDLPARTILKGLFRFIYSLSITLIALRIIIFDFSREATFLGMGPLTFARYVCMGWIAQILLDGKMKLLPSVVFGIALIIADSKGPILFLTVVMLILGLKSKKIKWIHVGSIVATLSILAPYFERFDSFANDIELIVKGDLIIPDVMQFENTVDQGVISSTVARIIAIQTSIELIAERPIIGWGIGSWPSITGLYYLEYPHNSILEIWFEYGIFGVSIFIYFICNAARWTARDNPYSIFVIFFGLLALTTGSIRDLRILLFFTIMAYHFMSKSEKCDI